MHAAPRDSSCVNNTGTKLFPVCAGTGKKICVLMWVVFLFQGFFSHQLPSFKGSAVDSGMNYEEIPYPPIKQQKSLTVKGNDKGSLVIWEQIELGDFSPHHSNYWWKKPWNTAFPKPSINRFLPICFLYDEAFVSSVHLMIPILLKKLHNWWLFFLCQKRQTLENNYFSFLLLTYVWLIIYRDL